MTLRFSEQIIEQSLDKKDLTKWEFETLMELPYLDLEDVRHCPSEGPLLNGLRYGTEEMPTRLVETLVNPDYFWFTCKHILNMKILPFQALILKELWTRPFPMLVATRGGGKCVTGNTLVMTNNGIFEIQDIVGDVDENIPKNCQINILGENGFKKTNYFWKSGLTNNIKLETSQGFVLEGTKNHPIRVVDNNSGDIIWKNLEELKIDDRVVIDRREEWFEHNKNGVPEDLAYLFGLLVGDGGYTNRGSITITTTDKEILDRANTIAIKYFGKPFREQPSSKYSSLLCGVKIWDDLMIKYGFRTLVCALKRIPDSILCSSKSSVASFLQGLFDTDGHVHRDKCLIEYCSKSERLIRTVQFILTKFGIISRIKKRLNKVYNRYYFYLYIIGKNTHKFYKEIGFKLNRKQTLLRINVDKKINSNIDIIPDSLLDKYLEGLRYNKYRYKTYDMTYEKLYQILLKNVDKSNTKNYQKLLQIYNNNYYYDRIVKLEECESVTYDVNIPDDHSFITNGLISHNSFLLGLFTVLRCLLKQGSKVIITGAGFRQAKIVFEYVEKIYNTSPLLRDLVGQSKFQGISHEMDRHSFRIGDSVAYAIPIGDGSRIRGMRATDLIADEMASIPIQIYENVISGFGAVAASPAEAVDKLARDKICKKYGIKSLDEDYLPPPNKSIIAGTAYYAFNHFCDYWQKWKSIIESRGNESKLQHIFKGEIPEGFDWRDFSIIRLPYDLLPDGFMDIKTVGKSRASISAVNFGCEYAAFFPRDSEGFFKRTLIESCVTRPAANEGKIEIGGELVKFHAATRGRAGAVHVMGIDPASEVDNFSIVVLELAKTHKRIVYCWTTTRKRFIEALNKQNTTEDDFYVFCCRKIRDLMRLFPCARIGLDIEGGGRAIREALHSVKNLEEGEEPIWEVIDPEKPKDSDDKAGMHLLECVNFSSAEWVSTANHTMRMDFESKTLLFPYFDPISLEMAHIEDNRAGRVYDTLEDCVMEIEELKDELSSIVISRTAAGNRDRWDTPEVKLPGGKKGRQRKDRYTSLLIANMMARAEMNKTVQIPYQPIGGFSKSIHEMRSQSESQGILYTGPDWVTQWYRNNPY